MDFLCGDYCGSGGDVGFFEMISRGEASGNKILKNTAYFGVI